MNEKGTELPILYTVNSFMIVCLEILENRRIGMIKW